MKLNDIMEIVHQAYPDGVTQEYWDALAERIDPTGSGDTLAEFIVREIADTYASEATGQAQLDEAARVIRRAALELDTVAQKLEDADPEFKR